MGRKKSKTSKQKQAKAAAASTSKAFKKTSSFGGVVVHKGGGGGNGQRDRINNSANAVNATSSSSSSTKRKNGKKRWASSNTKKLSMLDQVLKGNGATTPLSSTNEQSDFDKEFASLQERSLRQQQTLGAASRKTKRRKNNKLKNVSAPSMSPAILNMGPKSTEELMEETTANFVAHGMNDMGEVAPQQQIHMMNPNPNVSTNPAPMASNLLQVLATKKRSEWDAIKVQKEKDEEEFQKGRDPNNPFGALGGWQDDSDDEDADAKKRKKEEGEKILFAPASFSFGGGAGGGGGIAAPVVAAVTPSDDFEIDPDL